MSLKDFINEAGKNQKKEVQVNINTILSDIKDIYTNKDAMKKFLKRISPPSSGKHLKFFYVVDNENEHGETSVNYNEGSSKQPTDDFRRIRDAIISQKPTEWSKFIEDGLENLNDAARKSYIETYFLPKVVNPGRVTKDTKYAEKGVVASESQYETLGKAMVFYAGKCVSRLTDTDTKIDSVKFREILQGVFGAAPEQNRENDSFLMQFVTIEPKLKIDAAKNVINSIKQAGTSDNGEIEAEANESYTTRSSYVMNYLLEVAEENLQEENSNSHFIELPKRIEDFSQDIRIALRQAKNVAEKFPKQYNIWHEKLTAAFDRGVKEYQDLERRQDTKEIVNPITKKIERRHGKAWGLGGPNAFIRNSETLDKIVKDIKNQKWTIFNCGPKIVLGLFDAMEKGGKFYQDICDRMGGGYNQLKHAFKNTTPEDFNKLIKQYRGKNEKEAMAVAYAGVMCSLSQIYKLLAYGKIGTINMEQCTFNTENGNDNVPLIQIYVNNLLSSLNMYEEEEKVYQKWSEDTQAKQQEQINAVERQINNARSQDKNQNNEQQPKQESTKPCSLKNFMNEADVENEEKNIDKLKEELEQLKAKKARAGQLAINNYIAILDDYKASIRTIPDIQETYKFLRDVLFDEARAKDTASRLSNIDDNEDKPQQNDSYKPEFKLKMIDDKLTFDTKIKLSLFENDGPEEDNENDDGNQPSNTEKNNEDSNSANSNNNSDQSNRDVNHKSGNGNLDWLTNGAGKALCKVYEVMVERGDSLNINRFKELAKTDKEQEAKQHLKKVFGNLTGVLKQVNVMPIENGIVGIYSNSGDANVEAENIPGAIETYNKDNNQETEKKDEASTNHEASLKKLQELAGPNSSLFTDIVHQLNNIAYSGQNDRWFRNYQGIIEKAHDYEREIIKVLKAAYNNNDTVNEISDSIENSSFLKGLWLTISAAKRAMIDLDKRVEEDKKKQNNQAGNQ